MLSSSVDVPQTILAQPVSVVSHSVPHHVFEQSSPPHVVPQTMLCSSALVVPQTILPSSGEELLIVPQSSVEQTVPHTIVSPASVLAAPQVTSTRHALASGRSTPPPIRWFP